MNNKYPTTKPSLNLDFANTKSLDPRINFRRGTPGTYYDGVTHVKAEENLLSYSEDFSQWGAGLGLNIMGNSNIAPDGTSTASLIDDGTDAGYKQLYHTVNTLGGLYSASVYVKNPSSNGRRFLILSCYETLNTYSAITFDILNQTIQSSDAGTFSFISSSFSNVGNDWYRIEMNFESKEYSGFTFNINMSDSGDATWGETYTGSNQQLYIWGAQLEQRDTVTSYTATNGTPITKHQPKLMTASPDDARFDHDPITGESKGLLIEGQRTNLISYSEDFTQSFWNENRSSDLTNGHVFPNQLIAPDGVSLATKIIPKNVYGVHYISSSNLSLSKNTVYTASCYFKAAEIDTVSIALKKYDGSNKWVNFNLTDITTTTDHTFDDYFIEDVGNGWRRCSVSLNLGEGANADAGVLYFYVKQTSGWTGNNYDGLYMWGAQVEQATFPTSYIKATGASATRSADNASITGENFSSWYRQDEGSIYLNSEVHESRTASTYEILNLYKDSSNYIAISNTGRELISSLYTNGSTQTQLYNQLKSQIPYTINSSVGYKKDSASLFNKGEQVMSEDTSIEIPSGLDKLFIGNRNNSFWTEKLYIKKLAYYPQRLTNEQLQNLTK